MAVVNGTRSSVLNASASYAVTELMLTLDTTPCSKLLFQLQVKFVVAGRARGENQAQLLDRSWMKYTRCKVCGRRFCVNNYADRQVRVQRRHGVVACPWCKDRVIQMYVLVKELAAGDVERKKLRKKARKLLEQAQGS